MSDRDERLVPHDWVPSEPLDDYGSIHWECRRCDDFVTLASGESPDDVDHLQGCSPTGLNPPLNGTVAEVSRYIADHAPVWEETFDAGPGLVVGLTDVARLFADRWVVTSMTTGETWEEPLGDPVSPEDFIGPALADTAAHLVTTKPKEQAK